VIFGGSPPPRLPDQQAVRAYFHLSAGTIFGG
jgi:hypothetical protein